MGKIKGITITLIDKVKTGVDGFGHSVYEDIPIEVENVLISPTTADDVVSALNLTGRKAIYTLGIPKGDTHEWQDREVIFFGKNWRTFGIPVEGIEAMIPLEWNKKVTVERYE